MRIYSSFFMNIYLIKQSIIHDNDTLHKKPLHITYHTLHFPSMFWNDTTQLLDI